MKKIVLILIAIFCVNSIVVFATEPIEEPSNEYKQSILYRANINSLYSKWGWSQRDVITQYLAKNNGFKNELNVSDISEAATFDNIEYGNIVGLCEIDFENLDKFIVDNTLEQNINRVIKILNQYYIEIKCRDVTLGYMNINEDGRISHIIEPGVLKSDYIKNILPQGINIEPVVFLIEDNDYIQGIYVNKENENNIITYREFNNNTDNEQFYANNTLTVLKEVNKRYLIYNPRVDNELLKMEEIQQLIDEGKQRDTVLYAIVVVLVVVLVLVVIIFIKIIRRE